MVNNERQWSIMQGCSKQWLIVNGGGDQQQSMTKSDGGQ